MAATLYSLDILRLATSIPHLGRLADPQGSDDRRSPICGSRIIVDVQLDAAGHVIAFAQDVHACALVQASAHLLGAAIMGQTQERVAKAAQQLADWLSGVRSQPPEWPGIDVLEPARAHPGRHAAICLPFNAAVAAVQKASA